MKGIKLESGLIFGIIVLLLTTSIAPRGIGQTHTATQQQNKTTASVPSTEKTSSFTFYVIGKNGLEKQKTILSDSNTLRIYEKYQELKKETTSNPYSDKTQRIQQEFFDLLVENHALPTAMSKDQLLSLLQPPAITPKHLFTGISPFQNKASEWFCNFATFGTGSAFPIIILPRFIPFLLSPIPRAFVWWSTPEGLTSVGGLISRTGFLAGGQQKGIALGFWGIGFSIFLPPIMSYGIFGYAVFTRVTAEEFEFYPPNNPPEITQTDPADGQQQVPISTTELRFEINDVDNDLMSYNVTTYPDIGSGSGGLKPDGTYSIPVSGLQDLTSYTWHVEVTDGKDTTEETLTFTTEAVAPILSNPSPADGERDVPMDLAQLQFSLKDYQGDAMEYTVQTSPNIGSDHKFGVHDGTYTAPISGMTYGATYRWYVNVTDGAHWTRKLFSFETGYPSQFDPYEFGWHYRKQITIDHTQVLDDLTNFPVLVSTSDTDLSQKAQVDGGDILFMNDAGISTRLYYDLESYDPSSGRLVAWVNIPYLSSNSDTTFYMYYGNPTCINQQNPSKVWGSDYRMIHHFEESSGNIIDSTDNEFNGVISGSVTYGAEGKIGKAMLFIDANALINGITTSGNTFTISAWVKHGSDSNWKSIIDSLHGRVVFALYQGKVQYYDTDWRDSGLSYSTIGWNYVVISKSGTDITFFVNGIQTTNTGVNCNIGGTTRIGSSYDFDSTARFHGTIDELEVSTVARTNAWISTSYQNQNDPPVFLIIGPEEPGP